MQHYAVSSVNSMLVALNQYLIAVGLGKWKLRRVRVQGCILKMMERELQKSDYIKLVRKAKEQGKGTACNDYGDACRDRNPDQ